MISSKEPRLLSQDISPKMREAFEQKANTCECGHVRERHQNGTGKCQYKQRKIIKYKFIGRSRKGKKRKKEPVYEFVDCCGKFRPSIGAAGYVDDAFPAIFGAMPAGLDPDVEAARDVPVPIVKQQPGMHNRPPEDTPISGNVVDPVPKNLTTIEDNVRDIMVKKSSNKKNKPPGGIAEESNSEKEDSPFMEEYDAQEREVPKETGVPGKPVTAPHKVKTAFVSNSFPMGAYSQPLIGAGLVNWAKAYGSEILNFSELPTYESRPDANGKRHTLLHEAGVRKIEEFDWIFVNLAGTDIGIPTTIRRSIGDSSTKIIGINDYAIETLQNILQPFPNCSLMNYWTDIIHCHLLMAQEPYELEVFQYLVRLQKDRAARTGQKGIYPKLTLISHPVDTVQLKQYSSKVTMDMRQPIISVMYHRADGQTWYPSLLATDTGPSWFNGAPLKSVLYGYVDRWNIFGNEDRLFDAMFEYMTFGEFMQFFVTSVVAFDYYTIHSHSRFASEAACLRVPLVSTSFSYNATQLFPNTVAHYWEWHKLHDNINKLATDEKFWQATVDHAYDAVEEFGYEASMMKLKMAMDMVVK